MERKQIPLVYEMKKQNTETPVSQVNHDMLYVSDTTNSCLNSPILQWEAVDTTGVN